MTLEVSRVRMAVYSASVELGLLHGETRHTPCLTRLNHTYRYNKHVIVGLPVKFC